MDARYYPAYLEYVRVVPGDHLQSDGASAYLVEPVLVPGGTVSEATLSAQTRLSRDTGVSGNGKILYIFLRAVKQKLDSTPVTLNDIKLVDRNALEISKSLANSGLCRVIISDSAPPLIQPPVGEQRLFLPLVRK